MSNASIGPVGKLYFDKDNTRTKGFVPMVFEDVDSIGSFLSEATQEIDPRSTRVTIRVFVRQSDVTMADLSSVVIEIPSWNGEPLRLEAYVPDREGCYAIAYFGANTQDRVALPSVREREATNVEVANRESCRAPRQLAQGFMLYESQVGQNGLVESDVSRLCQIYGKAFDGYLVDLTDFELIDGMCIGNLVLVIRNNNGEIVSVAMAELATIELSDGQIVQAAEVSEVATHGDHMGRGFARVLYLQIVDTLVAAGVNFIYTEGRGNHIPILLAAAKAGMRPRGVLPQHCVLSSQYSDVQTNETHGDLVVLSL
jgi:beta-lysine N6-acetyltransferase